jgi:hypothetical protein
LNAEGMEFSKAVGGYEKSKSMDNVVNNGLETS